MAERLPMDHDLHQVKEPVIELTPTVLGRLRFMRHLAEQGKFSNKPIGPTSGDAARLLGIDHPIPLPQPKTQFEQQH